MLIAARVFRKSSLRHPGAGCRSDLPCCASLHERLFCREFGTGRIHNGRESAYAKPPSIDFVKINDKNSKDAQPGMMDVESQRANLEGFGKLVLADRELHDRLRTADVMAFGELAVKLGAERGYAFTVAIVREELQKKQRALRERWI